MQDRITASIRNYQQRRGDVIVSTFVSGQAQQIFFFGASGTGTSSCFLLPQSQPILTKARTKMVAKSTTKSFLGCLEARWP